MRKALLSGFIAITTLCACAQSKRPQLSEGPEAPYLKVIDAKCKELAKLGHVPWDFSCADIIGQYNWHGNGGGYFGTYEFYPPAFEQAKRSWYFHGKVIENSDQLWVQDRNSSESGIRFDDSVIGLPTGTMNMSYVSADGKFVSEQFTAKVVAVIDDGKNLKLSKRAPHHAEQWDMAILPDDYVQMCNCINNFHPPFVDGHPVVKETSR